MQRRIRDGVSLAFEESGDGAPPVVLVHGWTCDHTDLAPQFAHFRGRHRTVAVDLRGHGRSDKPQQAYSMALFAEDIAWLCAQLGLSRPVVVGHSLGGTVALELAARHPELPGAVVALDAPILVPAATGEMLAPLAEAFYSPEYAAAVQQFLRMTLGPIDDPARAEQILARAAATPRHVITGVWDALLQWDAAAAAAACTVPVLYIDAGSPNWDAGRFKELTPQLVTGATVGSGHWHELEVPDQVNAMIDRFLALIAADQPLAAVAANPGS